MRTRVVTRDHVRTVEEAGVDVRNVETVEPEVEHNGTVPVWWLINPAR